MREDERCLNCHWWTPSNSLSALPDWCGLHAEARHGDDPACEDFTQPKEGDLMAQGVHSAMENPIPAKPDTATIDSDIYNVTLYGILNVYGHFWTPLAFESEEAAQAHIRHFWRNNLQAMEECLRKFKIVPVRTWMQEITQT